MTDELDVDGILAEAMSLATARVLGQHSNRKVIRLCSEIKRLREAHAMSEPEVIKFMSEEFTRKTGHAMPELGSLMRFWWDEKVMIGTLHRLEWNFTIGDAKPEKMRFLFRVDPENERSLYVVSPEEIFWD